MTEPTRPPSAASRYAVVFVIGLVSGLFALLVILRVVESRQTWDTHYPRALMHLYQAQLAQLHGELAAGTCSPARALPRLETMRALSNDLEPAFPDLRDHRRFVAYRDQLRDAIDLALVSPPDTCAALETRLDDVQRACNECHRDFRH